MPLQSRTFVGTLSLMEDELTTAEAAELLNVSERFVDDRLDAGVLSFRLVGTGRLLRRADVAAYRDQMDARAEAALAALTAEAEDLGLYDS